MWTIPVFKVNWYTYLAISLAWETSQFKSYSTRKIDIQIKKQNKYEQFSDPPPPVDYELPSRRLVS